MTRNTEQEAFWETEFGDDYTDRNRSSNAVACNSALFAQVLARTREIDTVLELGSNIGLNLAAIRQLLPKVELSAVEINQKAANQLSHSLPDVQVFRTSILEFQTARQWDLVFSKGVLIHIDPEKLPVVYDLMHDKSSSYVLLAEYYNPTPTEVTYRGHSNRLFKRDFAGEMMDRHPDLTLIDYGFVYHRDPSFPQDDLTWFLLQKGSQAKSQGTSN